MNKLNPFCFILRRNILKRLYFKNPLFNSNKKNSFYLKNDFNIQNILLKYPTPFFLISEEKLLDKINFIETYLERFGFDFNIAYSVKTNNLPKILQIIKSKRILAEVVSGWEFDLAQKNGFNSNNIIFNGPMKLKEDILFAINQDSLIQIDNFDELDRIISILKELNKTIKVGIRINSRFFGKSRFGFNLEKGEIEKACKLIKKSGCLILSGIHMHLGYNMGYNLPPFIYKKQAELLSKIALKLLNLNFPIEYLNFGGSFPSENVRHIDSYSFKNYSLENYFDEIFKTLLKFFPEKKIKIMFEFGRSLIDDCIFFITKIVNANPFVADSSISMLPLITENNYLFSILNNNRNLSKEGYLNTTIYGNTCRENDILIKNQYLPKLILGDYILFKNVGAYNIPLLNEFSFPKPSIILLKKNNQTEILK
ncbi:MAG: alanine racemase [Candidatus Pacearchaeota archaeon]